MGFIKNNRGPKYSKKDTKDKKDKKDTKDKDQKGKQLPKRTTNYNVHKDKIPRIMNNEGID